MENYKLTKHTAILRLSDGASIPQAEGNSDYAQYLAWLAAGNTPLPIDPPTAEELAAEAKRIADAEAKAEAKADNVVQYLRDHTPAACADYVHTNVTDLASARNMLKKFAMVLSVLAKQNLR